MDINKIKTLHQLANYLRCQEDFLDYFLNNPPLIFDLRKPIDVPDLERMLNVSAVEVFYVPKRNKAFGYRKVHAIRTDNLRSVLITMNNNLSHIIILPGCVQGFSIGKNIRTNALQHLAKKNLLSVDICNFFETITTGQVEVALRKAGFSSFAADVISKLTTLEKYLPQGYHTSPILSNLVAREMDEHLMALCGKNITYTRYADDLYMSSDGELPSLNDIRHIIESNGFSLHEAKTKYMKRGQKQFVTGLTVFDKTIPRIPKKIKRNIRLELFYIRRFGFLAHTLKRLHYTISDYKISPEKRSEVSSSIKATKNRLEGWIRFIHSVEPVAAKKMKTVFESCEN